MSAKPGEAQRAVGERWTAYRQRRYLARCGAFCSPRKKSGMQTANFTPHSNTQQVNASRRLDDIQPYGLMIYRNRLRMIYTPSA